MREHYTLNVTWTVSHNDFGWWVQEMIGYQKDRVSWGPLKDETQAMMLIAERKDMIEKKLTAMAHEINPIAA